MKTSLWLEVLIKIVLCTLANFLAYWLAQATHTGTIFFCWIAPLVLILLPWKPRVLVDVFSLTVALVAFFFIHTRLHTPSDWPLVIYLGFIPILFIQLCMGLTAPWVRRKVGW